MCIYVRMYCAVQIGSKDCGVGAIGRASSRAKVETWPHPNIGSKAGVSK